MTVIAIGSVVGSPGATRLAIGLASAWPGDGRRRIVVEADADGGRLGAELGIGVEPGLMAVALAARSGRLRADNMLVTGAAAVGGWYAMPGPPSGEQASSVLAHASSTLAASMGAADDHLWLVDTGRLSTRSPALPFARIAERTLLVTPGSFPALQLVPPRVEALTQAGGRVGVVVVEPTSWGAAEVADFAGAEVLAVLPQVRHGRRRDIDAMGGGAWRGWWRSVERLATRLSGGDPLSDWFGPIDTDVPPLPSAGDAPSPIGPGWPA